MYSVLAHVLLDFRNGCATLLMSLTVKIGYCGSTLTWTEHMFLMWIELAVLYAGIQIQSLNPYLHWTWEVLALHTSTRGSDCSLRVSFPAVYVRVGLHPLYIINLLNIPPKFPLWEFQLRGWQSAPLCRESLPFLWYTHCHMTSSQHLVLSPPSLPHFLTS